MNPGPPQDRLWQLFTVAGSRWRQIVAVAAALAVVLPLAWMWHASRMPGAAQLDDHVGRAVGVLDQVRDADRTVSVAAPGVVEGVGTTALVDVPHVHDRVLAEGLVAHLVYSGVTVPYRLGDDTHNEPE